MSDDESSIFKRSNKLNRSTSNLLNLRQDSNETSENLENQAATTSNAQQQKIPPKNPTRNDSDLSSDELDKPTIDNKDIHVTQRRRKPFDIRVKYEVVQDSDVIDSENFNLSTNNLQLERFRDLIEFNVRKSLIPERDLSNWSVDSNMATPIKDITDLIKEYKGEAKYLNGFLKNIDKLWNHIATHEVADKNRFLLVLQLKLSGKAAEAIKDVEFANWEVVKTALKNHIKPPKNIEKAELKLTTVKQLPKEELETYAKRVEELMEDLNKCFELEEGYEVMKKENKRKARKAFENGLINPSLKNKAIARGCSNLKEVVDYVIEQELRLSEFHKYCSVCKMNNHNTVDCRRSNNDNFTSAYSFPKFQKYCSICRMNNHNTVDCSRKSENKMASPSSSSKREVTCYKCNATMPPIVEVLIVVLLDQLA